LAINTVAGYHVSFLVVQVQVLEYDPANSYVLFVILQILHASWRDLVLLDPLVVVVVIDSWSCKYLLDKYSLVNGATNGRFFLSNR